MVSATRSTPDGKEILGPLLVEMNSTIAKVLVDNIHRLGIPFDTEGDKVEIRKLEVGTIYPRSKLTDDSLVIYRRTKDRDLEWVSEWLNKAEPRRLNPAV